MLAQLRDAGIRLRYHGDFDWPGLQIGNRVVRRYGADSWRFDHDDYLAAASADGRPLRGREVDAIWDDALRGAMARIGTLVDEEQVMDDLLQDLR